MGQTALATTEHGTLAGIPQFIKQCKTADIKPICGIELYYAIVDKGARERDQDGERYYHLVAWALNNTGLKNLTKLSSDAYTENLYYKPRVTDAMLAEYNEGIACSSACLGSRFSKLILLNRSAEAERLLLHHAEIFKDRFFIELQLHTDKEQQTINKVLMDIARRQHLPMILTTDAHYTHKEHKSLHEQALCMQTNDVMYNPNRFSFGDIYVPIGSNEYMAKAALEQGIPLEALKNTQHIADMVDSDSYYNDVVNRYPTYPHTPKGMKAWEHLEMESKLGLMARFNNNVPEAYKTRLEHELDVIKKVGFADYSLIVSYIVNSARTDLDVFVGPGRGSAAGSLVMYALGVTQIDPIKYGLSFARFLSEARAANPVHFSPEMKAALA